MNFIDYIKEFKLLVTTISMVVVFIISGYTVYTDIYKNINQNTKQLELTQLSILKSQIRMMENNPCRTSRDAWAEYNMLYSQYYQLRKKHNPLLKEMDFRPMARLNKDTCRCYKGKCNE